MTADSATTPAPTEPDTSAPPTSPPVAKRVPLERTHHGDTFIDHYEWLRDKDDPEVIAYLEAENAWTAHQNSHLDDLRQHVFEEIKGRVQETDLSVPARRGEWWYYSRTVEGKQYSISCRCPVDSPDDWTPPSLEADTDIPGEQVLLDGNVEAEGHDFFSVGTFTVSPDGSRLAYAVDISGAERFTLRVKDLRTQELLADAIEDTYYGATWSLDASTLFYTTVDDAWRPYRVWKHRLGTAADTDDIVFEESDQRFGVRVGSTRSDRYIMIEAASKITSEVRFVDAATPDADFTVVSARRVGVEYSVEHAVVSGEDRFLVLHNDGAENFQLAEAPVTSPGPDSWRTVIAHRDDTRLESVDAFAGHVVVGFRRAALTRLSVLPLEDDGYGEAHEIEFEEELFTSGAGSNPEWAQPLFRLGYGSYVTPSTVYDYDVAAGELILRKQQPVLGGYDATDYEQHREWATAADGTQIPISVVCRRGVPRDGSAPALIYGYGSYEISMDPGFDVARLSLLDRGMVFAVAHIRGGGEMGRAWYENGKTLTKKNTFTDFVDSARHLVTSRWTSTDRLVALGGSAGGLLMGAVLNLAPDAFAGVVAAVPFVDALTSILDPSLPLTVIEWDEWGDPLHDAEVYAYIKSYTPYENLEAKDYPPILAITSLNDTRVLYVEPAKWVAALRATKTGDSALLLKTEMSAGHGGVSGRYEAWKERAYEYAWIIDTAGAKHDAASH